MLRLNVSQNAHQGKEHRLQRLDPVLLLDLGARLAQVTLEIDQPQ